MNNYYKSWPINFPLRMDEDMHARLRKHSYENRISMSAFIRQCIDEGLERIEKED